MKKIVLSYPWDGSSQEIILPDDWEERVESERRLFRPSDMKVYYASDFDWLLPLGYTREEIEEMSPSVLKNFLPH